MHVQNWFSTRDDFNSWGTLGNVWRAFWVVPASGDKCREAKDILNILKVHFVLRKMGAET